MENREISNLLVDVFSHHWDEIFLFDSQHNTAFTYKDFLKKIIQWGELFESLYIKEGDIVCTYLNNSVDHLVIYFACLIRQLIVVPLDPQRNESEINEALSQLQNYRCILHEGNIPFVPQGVALNIKGVVLDQKEYSKQELLKVFFNLDYEKLFLITFTSGSTGKPKGVMHSFRNLVLSAIQFKKIFSLDEKNIFYHNLSMAYMAGILNLIVLPFISSSKIVIGKRFTAAHLFNFWEIPLKYSINTFWFIPLIVEMLVMFDRSETIHSIKKYNSLGLVGTAPLNSNFKQSFERKYGIPLYESYGLSETLFVSSNYPSFSREKSVGRLLDDVHITFSPEGEILINVPWMFLGYFNSETSCTINEKFTSGDIGVLEEGFLKIIDRKKDLINKGGFKISSRKVEEFLKNQGFFEECVVLGIRENQEEKSVCFYVSSHLLLDKELKSIKKNIFQQLGTLYVVDKFIRIHSIPRNINNKVDKLFLKEVAGRTVT